MGRPPKCNPCCTGSSGEFCCTHRLFDGSWLADWSKHMDNERECAAEILDFVIASDAIYLVGWKTFQADPVVQKWTLAGVRSWTVNLDSDLTPYRVSSDGTQVWVVGVAPVSSSTKEVQAFASSDGTAQWDAVVPFGAYSVCSDGAGGCFVGTSESPEETDAGCESPDEGPIRRYNSSGTKIAHFGRNGQFTADGVTARTTALMVLGGKLWAGSGGFRTWLCCDIESPHTPWYGHLARYTFAGALEILCANPWASGGSTGDPPVWHLPEYSHVSRLVTADGRLYAGYQHGQTAGNLAGDMHCSVVEWDPDSGRMVDAWNIETDDSGLTPLRVGVTGMAAGTDFLATAADQYSLAVTDLDMAETKSLEGVTLPAVDSSDNVYAGIRTRKCTRENADQDITIDACAPGDPCNCGGPTPFGRIGVDCGCEEEDDGVPCTGQVDMEFTGCLEDFPSSVAVYLIDDDPPTWQGEFTVMSPQDCDDDYLVTVTVTYECPETLAGTGGGTWTIRYEITTTPTPGAVFGFEVEADSQTCTTDAGPPGFTFSATEDDSFGTFPECFGCDGWGGCGGMNDSSCGVNVDCCENTLPQTLTATVVNASDCACASGQTVTLNHSGGVWTGTGVFGSCGQNITIAVECTGDPAGWEMDVTFSDACASQSDLGLTENGCDPVDLESAPFLVSTCCGSTNELVYITITE